MREISCFLKRLDLRAEACFETPIGLFFKVGLAAEVDLSSSWILKMMVSSSFTGLYNVGFWGSLLLLVFWSTELDTRSLEGLSWILVIFFEVVRLFFFSWDFLVESGRTRLALDYKEAVLFLLVRVYANSMWFEKSSALAWITLWVERPELLGLFSFLETDLDDFFSGIAWNCMVLIVLCWNRLPRSTFVVVSNVVTFLVTEVRLALS